MNIATQPRLASFEVAFEATRAQTPAADAITVAVSLFNYERFVVECLDSIASQTHPHVELIVVDDCSNNDSSLEVALAWMKEKAAAFDRVSLLQHRRNQGLSQARNTAFHYSRTDLVFVIDADNQIYPRALARLYDVMRYREYDAAYTQIEFFGSSRRLGLAEIWHRDFFRHGNYVDAMALVSRRSWAQAGGYHHMEGGWEDFDFWCSFIDRGMRAAFVPEILCRYRTHPNSMLRTETDTATERLSIELTLRHPWLAL